MEEIEKKMGGKRRKNKKEREKGRKLARNTVKHYVNVFKHSTGTWDKDQS